MKSKRYIVQSIMLGLLVVASPAAQASVNLIQNGGFESTLGITTSNEILNAATLENWYSSDAGNGKYNYVYFPGHVTPSNPNGAYTNQDPGQNQCSEPFGTSSGIPGNVCLWGPNNAATFPVSPVGGKFVALDADPQYRNPLTQTVSNLTIGDNYVLSFFWGGAQYSTRVGPTTENLQISFGGDTAVTPTISAYPLLQSSFRLVRSYTKDFTATSTTQVLSFLADGTPLNEPPVVVLDGVSLTDTTTMQNSTPEPGYFALMIVGLVGLVAVARRRSKAANQAV